MDFPRLGPLTVARHPLFSALFVASALGLGIGGIVCLSTSGAGVFSTYLLAATGMLLIELYAWNTFFLRRRECAFGTGSPALLGKIVAGDVVLSVLLELGTLAGSWTCSPLEPSDWNVGRILLYLYALLVLSMLYAEYGHRLSTLFVSRGGKAHPTRELVRTWIVRLLPPVTYLLALAAAALLDDGSGVSWISLGTALGIVAVTGVTVLAVALERTWSPQRAFVWIALAAGLAFILPFPVTNYLSWDDEIHYDNALQLSYVFDTEETASDTMIIERYAIEDGFTHDATFGRFNNDIPYWGLADVTGFADEFSSQADAESVTVEEGLGTTLTKFSLVAYLPSAIGLWIGRLLHVPYAVTFVLGRLANLLSYVLVTYFAIRTIPTRKTLLCIVALLPTSIFLAANYSYDAWLTSWMMLAVALTVRELEAPEQLTLSRWALLLLVYFFALSPKAIYFPLMALLMLIPTSKYASKGQRSRYYLLAVFVALLVVSTFALGFLSTGGGEGDTRVFEEASGTGQVGHIMQNPLHFAWTLLSFLFGAYLSIPMVSASLASYGYLGNPSDFYPLLAAALVAFVMIIAVVESPKRGTESFGRLRGAAWALVLCVATLLLIAAALYISFTPVGSSTVEGVQPRYLIPLILPFCAFVLDIPHRWRINDCALSAVSLSVSALYLAFFTWELFSSTIVA